jgi:hypothetical protein
MSTPAANAPLFQMFGRSTAGHVECVNRPAYEQMRGILSRPLSQFGICTLLRAPRAGYGKSHLLCSLQQNLRGSHEFVLLHAAEGDRFDAIASLENVLTQLTRALPGGAGLTPLDLLARKVFALGLEPLVRSGEVPCQDRDSALLALSQRPTETFDFHHPSAVTAQWAREHFEVLGPRLIVELSLILQSPMRDITFWVEVLFRYSVTAPEHPGRLSQLLSTVGQSSSTAAHDRLSSLLHLLSQWQRMVLVVDELEGLSANPEAALRLATFLTTLRHGAERVDVILSVNDDIWENAFIPRLSGGLLDRLTEAFVRLTPLTNDEALALLQSRYPNATTANLEQLHLTGDLYARAVLRAAAQQAPLPIYSAPARSEEPAPPSPVMMPPPVAASVAAPSPVVAPVATSEPVTAPAAEPPGPALKWWEELDKEDDEFADSAPSTTEQPAFADSSPFRIAHDLPEPTETFVSYSPSPAPGDFAPVAAQEPAPLPPSHSTTAPNDSDRVNELLRQFRERYGNS